MPNDAITRQRENRNFFMKYIILFISILFFANYGIAKENIFANKNEMVVVPIDEKRDTLVKTSSPFQLNDERIYFTSDGGIESEFEYFKNEFFPFDFKNYSTTNLMQYFYQGVVVDSIIVSENVDLGVSPHTIYTYKLEDSYISFLVKDDSEFFYLLNADIKKDLFKSRNDVGIGISGNDFYRKIKTRYRDIKRFCISEGGITYQFDFKDNFLQSMHIENGF